MPARRLAVASARRGSAAIVAGRLRVGAEEPLAGVMQMARTNLLLSAAAVAVLSVGAFFVIHRSSVGATTADPVAYSFIAWGDSRPDSTALHAAYSDGWHAVRDRMVATPHAFEVVVGDMVNVDVDNDTTSTIDAKYAGLFSAMGATQPIPKSYAIGNHEAVSTSAAAAASWENNIHPAHYDVFTHGAGTASAPRVIVVNLSTCEPGHLGDVGFVAEGSTANSAQADWPVGQLRSHAQDPNTYLMVNMHHPIADPKPHESYDTNVEERQALEALFDEYGVDLVIAGHVHAYVRHMMADGTPYIVQGMAGAGPMGESNYSTSRPPAACSRARTWRWRPIGHGASATASKSYSRSRPAPAPRRRRHPLRRPPRRRGPGH